MADDIQSNIKIGIDTSDALVSIKNLQRQIAAFHSSMANGSAANAAASANLQKNLLNTINATGKFAASVTKVKSTTESFTDSLEKNKMSIGQYFKYAGGASKSFGKLFVNEFNTIEKVARERVKTLQTQYIRLGRDASGALQAMKVRPLVLDMDNLATKQAIAAQKQQILNQLLKQGSTNLLNFGKNTQWAGRQLMVGFTIPLSIFGTTAAKSFMQLEEQAIRFKRVYGDMFTGTKETDAMLTQIKAVASEFTKYGVAAEKTMGLAADAAASGKQGADLIAQVSEATRLAVLGQVEQQQALETTISVTNAFGTSAEELASKIDFLNAVENQTVTSISDLTTAIPKAGPVVKQLGGDVEDLAFLLTAMKEGGINASEGANAIKSGLASLINPTKKASEMLAGFGINIKGIVEANKGDIKGTVVDFATALDKLDPLQRARAIEQLFGKFQFARLSTLFKNVIGEGTQAQRVLDLAAATSSDLASLSAKELGRISESPMYKFKKAIEDIKVALAPIGETFLKLATPLIEFGTKVLNAFNSLDEKTKSFVTGLIAVVGGIGPVLLMTFGLLANGIANLIKGFTFVKSIFNKTTAATSGLGGQLEYMTTEQLNAAAVAASLDQTHSKLTQTFTSEAAAVDLYRKSLERATQAAAAFNVPAIGRTRPVRKMATGGFVSGSGNGDTVPAMLTPGEFVVKKAVAQNNMPMLQALNSGKIAGFSDGGLVGGNDKLVRMFAEFGIRLQDKSENMAKKASTTDSYEQILAPMAMRIGEARGITPSQVQVKTGAFDTIAKDYESLTQKFSEKLNLEFETTFATIKDSNERYRKAWQSAGKSVEDQVNQIKSDVDRGVVRKTFGLDKDFYGTVPTMPRREGGTGLERARKGAFDFRKTGVRSYNTPAMQKGSRELFERRTGKSASDMQMGHVFDPIMVSMQEVVNDPKATNAAKKAGEFIGVKVTNNASQGIIDSTRQASPSKEAYDAGVNIGRGAIQGIESQIDDAQRVGRKSRRVIANPDGSGGMIIQRPVTQTTQFSGTPAAKTSRRAFREGDLEARTKAEKNATSAIIENTAETKSGTRTFRNVSYALSGLSTIAMLSGQLVGDFGNIVLGASLAISAMTTAAEINAATGFLKLGPLVEGAKGVAGFLGRMVSVGGKAVMTVGKLAGVIGIAIAAISAIAFIANYINDQREKERVKVEGLGDAATLTAKKLEALGSFFGKENTPDALSGIGQAGAGVGVMSAEKQAAIKSLREDTAFQEAFAADIERLGSATKAQAIKTFETLSLTLFSKGYTKDQVQNIIDTLKIEAGKTDVVFEVKSFDIKTKKGRDNFKKSAENMVSEFNKAFAKGRTKVSTPQISGNILLGYKEEIKTTKEYDEALKTNSTNIMNRFVALQTMLQQGTITSKEYTEQWNILAKSLANGAGSAELTKAVFAGFTEEVKKTNPEFAALLPAVQGTGGEILVMQAIMAGSIPTVAALSAAISDLKTIQAYESGDTSMGTGGYLAAKKRIDNIVKSTKTMADAQQEANKIANDYGSGGNGEPSAFEKARKDIATQTTEIKNQINAFKKLKSVGYDTDTAFKMASNSLLAAALAAEKVGSKKWKELLSVYKEFQRVSKLQTGIEGTTLEGVTKTWEEAYSNVTEAFAAAEEQLNLAFKSSTATDNTTITNAQSQIALLQYSLDGLNSGLDTLQTKEDDINAAYDKRISALESIQSINEDIADQQKAQLTIADALSTGDIAAAARAVQDERARIAQAAAEQQKANLETARQNEINSLTINGKTKAQILTEIKDLQTQIKKIEIETIAPAQERIRLAEEKLQKDTLSLTVAGKTREQWDLIANGIRMAKTKTDEFIASLNAALAAAEALNAALSKRTSATASVADTGRPPGTITDASGFAGIAPQSDNELGGKNNALYNPLTGVFSYKSKGGMVAPKYFASGGFARGTDTVPSMLTPGEFVVSKFAVKDFGVDKLKAINSGNYSGESVYNYELNVNVKTDANANDIARTVMAQIKQIDSQRIRGNRL